MTLRLKKGQSLIEVVIALAVVVALAISLVTASLVTQRTSRGATSNTEATKLVQENIEQVRVLRDRAGFAALTPGSCEILDTTNADPSKWVLVSCSDTDGEKKTLNGTDFLRKISIADPVPAAPKKIVTVTVSWTDSGGIQNVSNTTELSNCVSVSCP